GAFVPRQSRTESCAVVRCGGYPELRSGRVRRLGAGRCGGGGRWGPFGRDEFAYRRGDLLSESGDGVGIVGAEDERRDAVFQREFGQGRRVDVIDADVEPPADLGRFASGGGGG